MKELAPSARMLRPRRAKTLLAAVAATAALAGGAQVLAPASAGAMAADELCETGFEWNWFLHECQEAGGSGGGGGPLNGGVGGGGGGTGGSDLWDGWNLDQGAGPETPEQKWARKEREAEERYQATVKQAKAQLDEVRMNLLLERVQWMDRQNERANRDREREQSGPDKSRAKKRRQARRPPV